ncbi:hypothetical protein Tco_0149142, partial [Tanacetum coccineum]
VGNIKETLGKDEPEVGSDIVKRALGYPMKLIAKNVDCKECCRYGPGYRDSDYGVSIGGHHVEEPGFKGTTRVCWMLTHSVSYKAEAIRPL